MFFYGTPLLLTKQLRNSNQTINYEIVKRIDHPLIELKKVY